MALPQTMRGIVLQGDKLSIKEDLQMPTLGNGEVLIRVHCSPINPSDVSFTKRFYQCEKPDPCIPGFEGSGDVVETGSGKRVGFATAQNNFHGAWGEYVVCSALSVVPLTQEVSYESGCNCIVNPLSALCMLETLQENQHQAIISTAAASQLGRMMQRLFTNNGIKVINIVRRQEQVDILKNEEKAEFVLNQSEPNFLENLKEVCQQVQPTAAFDAIGGPQTAQLVKCLKKGGTYYIYGGLDPNNVQISAADFIFSQITLKGW